MFDLIKTFRVLAVLLVAGFMVNCGGKKEEEELPADDMLSDIETVAPATTKDTAAAIPAKETAAEKKSALASRYTPNFSDNGKYVVQVSVFVARKAANRLATKFTEEGYAAYVAEVQNPTGDLTGTYYRVRIGNFSGVSDAKDFGENVVADMGYNFWIDNKSNDNVGGSMGSESSYGGYGTSSGSESSYPPVKSDWGSSISTSDYSTPAQTPAASSSDNEWGSSAPATPAPAPAPAPEPPPPAAEPAPAPAPASGSGGSTNEFDF